MKYLLIAMIMSLPAVAQVDLFVDGEKVVIPDNRKIVLVPIQWNPLFIVYHVEEKAEAIKPKPKDCGELDLSPATCVDD